MPTPAERWGSIRDNILAELDGETARRAALVAAGNPPPTSYSVGGKSVSWNEYLSTMMQQADEADKKANAAGADGLIEEYIRGYS